MTTNPNLSPDFPILDVPRDHDDVGRAIIDVFGHLDPYLSWNDGYCSIPVRLVHDQAAGFHLECGPCAFTRQDIDKLRAAIAAYDDAVGPSPEIFKDNRENLTPPTGLFRNAPEKADPSGDE
jgi:hypothetical protein